MFLDTQDIICLLRDGIQLVTTKNRYWIQSISLNEKWKIRILWNQDYYSCEYSKEGFVWMLKNWHYYILCITIIW